jgi:hypothetical protein
VNKAELDAALQNCRVRAAGYLAAQVVEEEDAQFWRHSPAHDFQSHSQHLLYGTWAGVHASILLGLDTDFSAAQRRRIANAVNQFQRPDGAYVMDTSLPAGGAAGEDEYFIFHCTNYALGAVRALNERPRYSLSFMERLMDQKELDRWLKERDWQRPWAEGNNIVNLASFYAILAEEGVSEAWPRLFVIADWLDSQQDENTGFWLAKENANQDLHVAMAGAAHSQHIYYYLGRTAPRVNTIIESCLRLGHLGLRSACVDLDLVDLLTNLRRYDYRVSEIDRLLFRYLVELLDVQNADGGFCDNYVTPHLLYGQNTPAGVSVTWTTWFRLATIGMIACALFPEQVDQWHFRRTLGSGYWNPNFALAGVGSASRSLTLPQSTRLWWTAKREVRFYRQRLTFSLRQRFTH